jgi:hypothetical protein
MPSMADAISLGAAPLGEGSAPLIDETRAAAGEALGEGAESIAADVTINEMAMVVVDRVDFMQANALAAGTSLAESLGGGALKSELPISDAEYAQLLDNLSHMDTNIRELRERLLSEISGLSGGSTGPRAALDNVQPTSSESNDGMPHSEAIMGEVVGHQGDWFGGEIPGETQEMLGFKPKQTADGGSGSTQPGEAKANHAGVADEFANTPQFNETFWQKLNPQEMGELEKILQNEELKKMVDQLSEVSEITGESSDEDDAWKILMLRVLVKFGTKATAAIVRACADNPNKKTAKGVDGFIHSIANGIEGVGNEFDRGITGEAKPHLEQDLFNAISDKLKIRLHTSSRLAQNYGDDDAETDAPVEEDEA